MRGTHPNAQVAIAGGDREPTDGELAGMVAAIEVTWPRPVAVPTADLPRWRFSGRSWAKPVPLRRVRPWAR
jgi:hypothetical protein